MSDKRDFYIADNARLAEEVERLTLRLKQCGIQYDKYDTRIEKLELSEELAWGIIANAYGGDWNLASGDWVDAATRWRDKYLDAIAEVNDE